MELKKGPKNTKNRPQEASKCLLERRFCFKARSNLIFIDFGLQHGLNMGSKIAQKTLKNRLGRPKAAEKPQGTHFDSKLSPFWTILGTKNGSKSAAIDFVALGLSRRLKESISQAQWPAFGAQPHWRSGGPAGSAVVRPGPRSTQWSFKLREAKL